MLLRGREREGGGGERKGERGERGGEEEGERGGREEGERREREEGERGGRERREREEGERGGREQGVIGMRTLMSCTTFPSSLHHFCPHDHSFSNTKKRWSKYIYIFFNGWISVVTSARNSMWMDVVIVVFDELSLCNYPQVSVCMNC